MKTPRKTIAKTVAKVPTLAAIRRAVASSTALETGQDVAKIERRLCAPSAKARRLRLAD